MSELEQFTSDEVRGLTPSDPWGLMRVFVKAPANSCTGRVRRHLLLAAKLGVTIAAFWFVASLTNVGEALALMRTQNPGLVALAAVAVLAQIVLGALRWRAVLMASARQDAANISPLLAFRLYYASIFFNSFLPGTFGGDVIRAVSTRALGVTTGASVHSVVLDRMLALTALLAMALPALPLVWGGIGLSSTILASALGAIVALGLAYLALSRIPQLSKLRVQTDRVMVSFWRALGNLISHPGPLLVALPVAFGAHAAYCVGAFLLAQSLNVELGLVDALTLLPLVLLFSTLPISIGGWGVREVGAIGLLGLVGIASHEAVIISLQFGAISVLMSLPGALFWIGLKARATAR